MAVLWSFLSFAPSSGGHFSYLSSLCACIDLESRFFLLPLSVACFPLTWGGKTPAAVVFWQQLTTWVQARGEKCNNLFPLFGLPGGYYMAMDYSACLPPHNNCSFSRGLYWRIVKGKPWLLKDPVPQGVNALRVGSLFFTPLFPCLFWWSHCPISSGLSSFLLSYSVAQLRHFYSQDSLPGVRASGIGRSQFPWTSVTASNAVLWKC